MPCIKCNSDFNMFNWKLKCYECEDNHCSRCLKKHDGNVYCDICSILIKRPPDKERLMKLKAKDIRNYLTRNRISVHGLVEKQELVDLFFKNGFPNNCKKNGRRCSRNVGGAVPNLANAQACFNNLRSNAEAAFLNHAPNFGAFGQPRTNNMTQGNNISNNREAGPSTNMTYTPTAPQVPSTSNITHQVDPRVTSNTTTSSLNKTNQPIQRIKISDFKSLDDLNHLSPKELKELLTLNRVDFKGCVEKAELVEKANILWIDANISKSEENDDDMDNCCKICMDAPLDCVLLECGHIATCINCGKQLNECPICRQYVIRVVRTFKA